MGLIRGQSPEEVCNSAVQEVLWKYVGLKGKVLCSRVLGLHHNTKRVYNQEFWDDVSSASLSCPPTAPQSFCTKCDSHLNQCCKTLALFWNKTAFSRCLRQNKTQPRESECRSEQDSSLFHKWVLCPCEGQRSGTDSPGLTGSTPGERHQRKNICFVRWGLWIFQRFIFHF